MATSKSLSKMRSASRICKIGAVVIGVIGFVATALYISSTLSFLTQLQSNQTNQNPGAYLSVILPLFLLVVPTLFFVLALYAMGTLLDFMGDKTKSERNEQEREEEELDYDRMEIVPLPDMR